LDWIGLDWIDSIKLDWIGSNWIELDRQKTPQTRAGRGVTHRIVENTERATNDQSHQSNSIKSNPIQSNPKKPPNSSQKLLFDGLSKIDVPLERGCKKCKNAHDLEWEASFYPKKQTTQTRAARGVTQRIMEITERVKTEGRSQAGRSRLYGPSFSSRTWKG
jgi:hypothetical protein